MTKYYYRGMRNAIDIGNISGDISANKLSQPIFAWLVNHPVVSLISSLIVIILTVRLLVTIYRAIA